MKTTILFDLGQNLARYYDRSEIPVVLEECINSVRDFLRDNGVLAVSDKNVRQRVHGENREAVDYLVRPLEDRLARIFDLAGKPSSNELIQNACHYFMKPIYGRGQLYDDALPALIKLKAHNYRTALISNTPWGSPANLWREEIKRLGIAEYLDVAVFCRDVGWRKPAPHIFTYALHQLRVPAGQCLFIGDNPVWDVEGPQAVGIEALLIDRKGKKDSKTITSIAGLFDVLKNPTP